jgi:hypothetical protein
MTLIETLHASMTKPFIYIREKNGLPGFDNGKTGNRFPSINGLGNNTTNGFIGYLANIPFPVATHDRGLGLAL